MSFQKKKERRLLFTFEMVGWFNAARFGAILEEMFEEKKAHKEIDRMSSLPNDIIRHIFSFMDTKSVIQTCVLSKTWRYRWTLIPSLNLE